MSTKIDGTLGVIFPDNSSQNTAATGFGFKNRLINGAMMIDQRNAGASVTPSTSTSQYLVDRWKIDYSQTSKITAQQSTTAPAGFKNSLQLTVASVPTVGASDYFLLSQPIEGVNVADMAFGSASAATITISFQVRSSVTGTYPVTVRNSANNRTYIGTYTINSANTFESKTVTLTGDTSGTWLTDTGVGMNVIFDLGSGSNFNGTAGSWAAGNYFRTSGTTTWITNAGATFYITGVQLEKGSTATSFDYRPYGTELALCQRYYNKSYSIDVTPGTNTSAGSYRSVSAGGAGWVNFDFPVEMRVAPTVTPYSNAGTSGVYGSDAGNWTPNGTYISTRRHSANGLVTSGNYVYGQYVASSEL